MTMVQVNGRVVETALIAFDKDGTLIDLHYLWGQKVRQWVDALLAQVGESDALESALYHSLGFDTVTNQVMAAGPLAITPLANLYTVVSTVLYQHGLPWHKATDLAETTATATMGTPPLLEQLNPIGDVMGTIQQLAAAGIKIGIVTSDDRAPTELSLPLLGIQDAVDILICGDDDLPHKPDPAGFHFLSQKYNLDPSQMMMVGDTTNDMLFGKNAGVACCVGIANGEQSGPAFADVVVSSIEAIQIV
ncbi:MAG: HAD family hydrolase [Chloroflexi bacterium]|nr:HAD family hydrolase [Chloroflexota bacterium]